MEDCYGHQTTENPREAAGPTVRPIRPESGKADAPEVPAGLQAAPPPEGQLIGEIAFTT